MRTKDFLGREWDIDCMGCAISKGSMSVPGGFIQRTQHFYVHQDPLIPLEGFLVIASTRHIRSISEMQDTDYEDLSKLIRDAEYAIKEVTKVEHLTIVQEESSIHFHLWFFPWTQEVIERYGQPSLTKIREIMTDYRKRPIDEVEWKELEILIKRIKARMTRG
jgi:diadenosine tetraphosphate (Ap4A) HIT family hydrolase